MQNLPTRLERLLGFLEGSPSDTFILYAIGKEYEALGNLEKALQYFQKLLEIDPNYVGCYYHLGKLFEKLNEPAKAFAAYKLGMQVAQKISDQHAYSELAGAKMNLGDDEDFE